MSSIAEVAPLESDVGHTTDEPLSPASEYFRAADISRKRRSLMLHRYHSVSPNESTDYSVNASQTLVDPSFMDMTSPRSEGDIETARLTDGMPKPSPAKAAHRRTLLLLTKSKGVQTDPSDIGGDTVRVVHSETIEAAPSVTSAGTSPRPEGRSETSSLHPPTATAGPLLALVDHLSKLLSRLRAADIPTLNKRLKKQHLPGDVSHLSRSALRALHAEIGETKNHFRNLLDTTSVQRKEWNVLFKLLKEVFTELVDMQAVINDVTLEPKLAKRLQKEAFRDEEAEEAALAAAAAGGVGAGLGWIANPITRLFVTPAAEPPGDVKVGGRVERGKLQAVVPAKSAPKQAAVSGATTTHVSVEFGGAGIVRRATPAAPAASGAADALEALPPSPNPMALTNAGSRQVSADSSAATVPRPAGNEYMGTTRTLRPPGTLRPSKSRANRNELLGIFAGAQRPVTAASGHALPAPESGSQTFGAGPSKLRNANSQYFGPGGESTIRARDGTQRKRLSAVVDAVIDTDQVDHHEDEHGLVGADHEQPFQPLLARTLRPRGLSDSSIRSTFVSHAASSAEMVPHLPPIDTGVASTRQGGYTGGFMAGLGRRLYWTKAEVSPINPIDAPPPSRPEMPHRIVSAGSAEPKPLIQSTSKPISVSPSPNKRANPHPPNAAANPQSQSVTDTSTGDPGFLGRLIASSLAGDSMTLVDDSEDEGAGTGVIGGRSLGSRMGGGMLDRVEREEMMGASLRQGVIMGRSTSRAGTRWD